MARRLVRRAVHIEGRMLKKNPLHRVFQHIDTSGGPDACWPWKLKPGGLSRAMRDGKKASKSKGRPYVQIDGRKYTATRLVYELVNGVTLSPKEFILHSCDNSICCNPKHMSVGTHQANMDDMVERDRHGLPHATVRRIRVLLASGYSHRAVAAKVGTSKSTVTRIAANEIHTHPDDYPQTGLEPL